MIVVTIAELYEFKKVARRLFGSSITILNAFCNVLRWNSCYFYKHDPNEREPNFQICEEYLLSNCTPIK